MALHWAWSWSIGASYQNLSDSGWQVSTSDAYRDTAQPRQPIDGFGGMTYAVRLWAVLAITPTFPKGALSDGIIQFHFKPTSTTQAYGSYQVNANRWRLLAADGTVLLHIQPETRNDSSTSCVMAVYSGEGGTLVRRGALTSRLYSNTWQVISIRFKPGTSGGYISVGIDGVVDDIVVSGNVGATSAWGRFEAYWSTNSYLTGITVWDSAADPAMTTTYWTPTLRPIADNTDGSWLNQSGSAVDMYQSVDDTQISTTDYCTTTTDPDEVRFDVETDNIDPSWAPASIDGVSVIASMRGDGTLNTGQPVIDDGSNNLLGTSQTTDADTSCGVNDVFPRQADDSPPGTGTPWTKAALETHSFGVKAS